MSDIKEFENYELYHDESIITGYWHGMLLVPLSKKESILSYLTKSRNNLKYDHKIRFTDINRYGPKYLLASAWLSIALGFLRSSTGNKKLYIFEGAKKNKKLCYPYMADNCLGMKFILFKERDNYKLMENYPDTTSKIETIFRFGLKGGLHYLFSDNNPVNIIKMHFDGYEHHKRHIDPNRIVGRLNGLRSYCSINNSRDIIDDGNSDHKKVNSQEYSDCQLLQLTDLMIGAFRYALGYHHNISNRFQENLAGYTRILIDKYSKGLARMRNSRWFESFCMSECYLELDSWKFDTIDHFNKSKSNQLPLF